MILLIIKLKNAPINVNIIGFLIRLEIFVHQDKIAKLMIILIILKAMNIYIVILKNVLLIVHQLGIIIKVKIKKYAMKIIHVIILK